MKKLLTIILPLCIANVASAQMVRGSSAHIECDLTNKPGASISVTEMSKGKALGTYSMVSNGKGTDFKLELDGLNPKTTVLELLSGTNVVRKIPGHGPSGIECGFENEVAYSLALRPDEDWVLLAAAAGIYLVSCADYIGSHDEVTRDADGNIISTTHVGGHWEWNCGFPFMTVSVDGHDYQNITGLQFRSVCDGELPPVDVLNISARGGAKATSVSALR